jgi:hypothetical protein
LCSVLITAIQTLGGVCLANQVSARWHCWAICRLHCWVVKHCKRRRISGRWEPARWTWIERVPALHVSSFPLSASLRSGPPRRRAGLSESRDGSPVSFSILGGLSEHCIWVRGEPRGPDSSPVGEVRPQQGVRKGCRFGSDREPAMSPLLPVSHANAGSHMLGGHCPKAHRAAVPGPPAVGLPDGDPSPWAREDLA